MPGAIAGLIATFGAGAAAGGVAAAVALIMVGLAPLVGVCLPHVVARLEQRLWPPLPVVIALRAVVGLPAGLRHHHSGLWALVAVVGAAAVALRFGHHAPSLVVVGVVTGAGVLAAAVDLRCHRLPDALTAPTWLLVWPVIVGSSVFGGDPGRIRLALAGGLVAVAALGFGWVLGMGLGDVKFGAVMAVVVGWLTTGFHHAITSVLAMVVVASGASALWAVAAGLRSGARTARVYAFGPWLVAAAVGVVMVNGPVV